MLIHITRGCEERADHKRLKSGERGKSGRGKTEKAKQLKEADQGQGWRWRPHLNSGEEGQVALVAQNTGSHISDSNVPVGEKNKGISE